MDILKNLNASVEYIEANLFAEKIDFAEAAKRACLSADFFMRFFSYMTGMTLNSYIRCRRLTVAAEDIRNMGERIIDIAVKCGYESADAFSRAFARQHGITPSAYRKNGGELKIYPPASFHIIVKGAKKMNFRIIELVETEVLGISKQFEGQCFKNREELRNIMWSDYLDDVPGQICFGKWNEPDSAAFDGVWYGIWQDGKYMIARAKDDAVNDKLEARKLPSGTYAAFKTECGGYAWEEFPKLFKLIFDSWLPSSEYKPKSDLAVEVLHLWTDREKWQKNRYYEVWIPVELK